MVGLLCILLIQSSFAPLREIPLAGAEKQREIPSQPLKAWFHGSLQSVFDQRAGITFGFRPMLVRFVNQVRYTLFEEHTPHVVTGKDGYLFEASYRAAVCGENFVGQDSLATMLNDLNRFRTQLDKHGIALVVMIAPNKWRTLKSKVKWNCKPTKKTNYNAVVSELRANGYAVCDMIELFNYDQGLFPDYPLHSKQGTHWSVFGATMSVDYLSFAFAQEDVELPKMTYESIDEISKPRYTDKDLHDLLNLMERPAEERLAYPNVSFATSAPPKVTVIGDSYYWTYYYIGAHQGLFSHDSKFFYYNNSMVSDDPDQRQSLNDSIRINEVSTSDAVLLVMGEPSLAELGLEFRS